jgi:hypothetical protein
MMNLFRVFIMGKNMWYADQILLILIYVRKLYLQQKRITIV